MDRTGPRDSSQLSAEPADSSAQRRPPLVQPRVPRASHHLSMTCLNIEDGEVTLLFATKADMSPVAAWWLFRPKDMDFAESHHWKCPQRVCQVPCSVHYTRPGCCRREAPGGAAWDSWLGTWLKNHRKLNTERKCKWIQSFRSQMQREYGTMEELLQAPPAEWPSVLKFGDFSFDAKETCLTLCNPTLLHETLSRLSSRNTSSCAATGLLDLPPKSGSFWQSVPWPSTILSVTEYTHSAQRLALSFQSLWCFP